MPCPNCGGYAGKVIDSRLNVRTDKPYRRRRRVCGQCDFRFTTKETICERLVTRIIQNQKRFGVEHGAYDAVLEYARAHP